MPYVAQQCLFDGGFPTGSYYYTEADFLPDLTDEADRVGSEMPDEHDPINERGQDERHVSALRDLSEVCQSLLAFHYLLSAPRRSGSTDTENGRSRPTKIGRSTCD
jgi:hypothetical protein